MTGSPGLTKRKRHPLEAVTIPTIFHSLSERLKEGCSDYFINDVELF